MASNSGNPPAGAKLIHTLGAPDTPWDVWLRNEVGDWIGLKVVLVHGTRGLRKRNYWLGWSKKEHRLSKTPDTFRFIGSHPKLYDELVEYLTAFHSD